MKDTTEEPVTQSCGLRYCVLCNRLLDPDLELARCRQCREWQWEKIEDSYGYGPRGE